jgi:hypothetical protein
MYNIGDILRRLSKTRDERWGFTTDVGGIILMRRST